MLATGWRRGRAAALLRALGAACALAAAAGPHRIGSLPRPQETLVAVEGDSLPRAVAAALAGRDPGADARLLAEVGDRPADDRAAVESLRLDLPVLVRRVPSPSVPAAPDEPPWLEGLAVPPTVAAGEPFLPRPLLSAGAAADAAVTLSVDGKEAPAGPLVLSAGSHLLSASCRDAAGRDRGTVAATVTLPGPPEVLVVEHGSPSAAVRALEVQGLRVTRAASPPADLAPYAVVVLGSGSSGDAALETAVRHGKGLLVLGAPGEDRGLGRLRGTPVERALPVFLAPPLPPKEPPPEPLPPTPPEAPPPGKGPEVKIDEGDRPGAVVTLLLVVDTSGSMWGLKLEMARRAAAAAASMLAKEDRFGLLSFSDGPRWEIPLGPAGDRERIESSLRALRAGGGTEMLPALQEARRALRRETTAVRHCVVLSDGETSPFGLRKVVEEMVGEGATMSTVGIGGEYDARLLGNLSTWGKGRTFPAIDPATLPQIVTLDTERVVAAGKEARAKAKPAPDLPAPPPKDAPAKPAETPKPRPPALRAALETVDPCAILDGLGPWPSAVPPEAAPEARQATTLALRFEGGGGPALVIGRHGLGRTAAFSFDPADLAGWEGFPAAMARLVRGLAEPGAGPAASLVGVLGDRVEFEVRGSGDGPAPPPSVRSLDPAGDTPTTLAVERVAARRFAVRVPPGRPGARTLVVDGVPLAFVDRGPAPPPAPDPGRAARIAREAGAVLVEGDLPPWPPARPGLPKREPLELPLLAAAAALLVADTALRRLRPGG